MATNIGSNLAFSFLEPCCYMYIILHIYILFLWIQDERELKRQRRKQSNRESARRSRLRKQVRKCPLPGFLASLACI
jgi:hypothetical protein